MEQHIGHEIKVIDNLILRRMLNDAPKDTKISPIQFSIILFLIKNKDRDIYQKDIEKKMSLRRSTISGILQTMEKNGIIERTNSNIDGRSKKIILTEKAISRQKECKKDFQLLDNIIKEKISEEDLTTFFKVTNQIKKNLNEEEK